MLTSGTQAVLHGVWEVSVGSELGLMAGLVELDVSFSKRPERKQIAPFILSSWLQALSQKRDFSWLSLRGLSLVKPIALRELFLLKGR
jgi:hypothetical protein